VDEDDQRLAVDEVGDLLRVGAVAVRVRSGGHGDLDPDRFFRRPLTRQPADRIRTLLLRADNVLKNEGDPAARQERARKALEEARTVAQDASVDVRLRGLIERRLDGLDQLG
jgi:hypothetical protein